METNTLNSNQHPFFDGLSESHLQILLAAALSVEVKAGEIIFNEGAPANRFYLIKSGTVALESRGQDYQDERSPVLIETLGSGDVLGWSWLFPPYYWHFDARAITPVKAIFFYGTSLREQCEHDHELGYQLMKRTAEITIRRLQATRRRLMEPKGLLVPQ